MDGVKCPRKEIYHDYERTASRDRRNDFDSGLGRRSISSRTADGFRTIGVWRRIASQWNARARHVKTLRKCLCEIAVHLDD